MIITNISKRTQHKQHTAQQQQQQHQQQQHHTVSRGANKPPAGAHIKRNMNSGNSYVSQQLAGTLRLLLTKRKLTRQLATLTPSAAMAAPRDDDAAAAAAAADAAAAAAAAATA
jgi:hypothetical protein